MLHLSSILSLLVLSSLLLPRSFPLAYWASCSSLPVNHLDVFLQEQDQLAVQKETIFVIYLGATAKIIQVKGTVKLKEIIKKHLLLLPLKSGWELLGSRISEVRLFYLRMHNLSNLKSAVALIWAVSLTEELLGRQLSQVLVRTQRSCSSLLQSSGFFPEIMATTKIHQIRESYFHVLVVCLRRLFKDYLCIHRALY